jgi:hypothetical protein
MKRKSVSILGRTALVAFFALLILPVTTFAQRRWVVVRPHRNRVVVYQPRPYVNYQRQPVYSYGYTTYSQPYYANQYYSSGYSQPYYTNQYYSYGYTQPYYVNRYAYADPYYRSNYYGSYPRYRRSRFRIGIRLR